MENPTNENFYDHRMIGKSFIDESCPDWTTEELSTGTTIMAMEFKGGVVIAADSRTTTGAYIANRVTNKLTKITDQVYVCRSGSAADTQAIAEIVAYEMGMHEMEINEPPAVETVAQSFRNYCYNYRDQLMAGIIVAGWDRKKGGQVYSIPLGGMITRLPFAFGGSGSTYVWGHVDARYKEKTADYEMSKEECIDMVKECVYLAMVRDGSSGGVLRMAVITEEGVDIKCFSGKDLPTCYRG